MNFYDLFKNNDKKIIKNRNKIIDNSGRLLCTINKKYIYDLNDNIIFSFSKKEKVENKLIYYYINATCDYVILKDNNLYYNNELKGRVINKTKLTAVLLSSIILALIIASIVLISLNLKIKDSVVPEFNITEKNGNLWQLNEEIDIFGPNLKLAPGTNGEYEFNITNLNEEEIIYKINLVLSYQGKNQELVNYNPFNFSLKMNNVDVLTLEKELNLENIVFLPNSSHNFIISYEWPFEENNSLDELVGQDAGLYKIELTITGESA